jgi:hypothetical protein
VLLREAASIADPATANSGSRPTPAPDERETAAPKICCGCAPAIPETGCCKSAASKTDCVRQPAISAKDLVLGITQRPGSSFTDISANGLEIKYGGLEIIFDGLKILT